MSQSGSWEGEQDARLQSIVSEQMQQLEQLALRSAALRDENVRLVEMMSPHDTAHQGTSPLFVGRTEQGTSPLDLAPAHFPGRPEAPESGLQASRLASIVWNACERNVSATAARPRSLSAAQAGAAVLPCDRPRAHTMQHDVLGLPRPQRSVTVSVPTMPLPLSDNTRPRANALFMPRDTSPIRPLGDQRLGGSAAVVGKKRASLGLGDRKGSVSAAAVAAHLATKRRPAPGRQELPPAGCGALADQNGVSPPPPPPPPPPRVVSTERGTSPVRSPVLSAWQPAAAAAAPADQAPIDGLRELSPLHGRRLRAACRTLSPPRSGPTPPGGSPEPQPPPGGPAASPPACCGPPEGEGEPVCQLPQGGGGEPDSRPVCGLPQGCREPVLGLPQGGGEPVCGFPQGGGEPVGGLPQGGGEPGWRLPQGCREPVFGLPQGGGEPVLGLPPGGYEPVRGLPQGGGAPVFGLPQGGCEPVGGLPPSRGDPGRRLAHPWEPSGRRSHTELRWTPVPPAEPAPLSRHSAALCPSGWGPGLGGKAAAPPTAGADTACPTRRSPPAAAAGGASRSTSPSRRRRSAGRSPLLGFAHPLAAAAASLRALFPAGFPSPRRSVASSSPPPPEPPLPPPLPDTCAASTRRRRDQCGAEHTSIPSTFLQSPLPDTCAASPQSDSPDGVSTTRANSCPEAEPRQAPRDGRSGGGGGGGVFHDASRELTPLEKLLARKRGWPRGWEPGSRLADDHLTPTPIRAWRPPPFPGLGREGVTACGGLSNPVFRRPRGNSAREAAGAASAPQEDQAPCVRSSPPPSEAPRRPGGSRGRVSVPQCFLSLRSRVAALRRGGATVAVVAVGVSVVALLLVATVVFWPELWQEPPPPPALPKFVPRTKTFWG
ncbi:hypothetical protein DIPPA_28479 [Diplonema papillatum]|nr:hypothetical protein DIPPA_28479 [Diplonema papillatum]